MTLDPSTPLILGVTVFAVMYAWSRNEQRIKNKAKLDSQAQNVLKSINFHCECCGCEAYLERLNPRNQEEYFLVCMECHCIFIKE